MATVSNADIYGRTISCECGRVHRISPCETLYARGAAEMLPELCARATEGRRAVVIADSRTREVAGRAVCRALANAGWKVSECIVPDTSPGHSPVCDDVTKEAVAARMGETDLIVPAGGGVITDMARWIAFERKLPFVSFGTAASMNGYASANVAATVRGVKVLIYARAPMAVAADPEIIENAPYELTVAGLGDILAKPISTTDWRLNELLFGDYYCARSVGLVAGIEPMYMDNPESIKARDTKAIEALFNGLLLTGVSMNMAETSAPCSGGEHLLSHTLDMMSILDGHEHDLHGRQVGLGAILAAELYTRVMAIESPAFVVPSGGIDRAFWGTTADAAEKEYAAKVERMRAAAQKLRQGGEWDKLRRTLAPMLRAPEKLRDCLSIAGGAYKAEHIKCSKERVLTALLHAHEIRARFTILDLARLAGVMPGATGEIVEAWA